MNLRPTALLCLCLAVFSTSIQAQSGGGAIRFESPRNLATVLGETSIELAIAAPRGRTIVEVEVFADDELVGRKSSPPWTFDWTAGDGSRGHRLRAVVRFSDGSTQEARIRTSALRINQIEEVDLVNLYPVVLDRQGNFVTDLGRDDFQVLEDGREQTIERFSAEQRPLVIGIVLDTSLSMRGERLDAAQRAATSFLQVLGPEDRAMIVGFGDRVRMEQELTSDGDALGRAIRDTEAEGGTALYDAVWRTARRLDGFDGRRVLVLLSDGRDESATGFGPGSLHTLEEAMNRAQRSDVKVFTIGLGKRLDRQCSKPWARRINEKCGPGESQRDILNRLAEDTGGRLLLSSSPGKLARAFEDIAEALRHQYSISYSSSNDTRNGAWRSIDVQTLKGKFNVVARKGYYASTDESLPSSSVTPVPGASVTP